MRYFSSFGRVTTRIGKLSVGETVKVGEISAAESRLVNLDAGAKSASCLRCLIQLAGVDGLIVDLGNNFVQNN